MYNNFFNASLYKALLNHTACIFGSSTLGVEFAP